MSDQVLSFLHSAGCRQSEWWLFTGTDESLQALVALVYSPNQLQILGRAGRRQQDRLGVTNASHGLEGDVLVS